MSPVSTRGITPEDAAPLEVPVIEVERLRDLLERRAEVAVLDIRPAAERAEWFIPGSLHRDAYQSLKAGERSALADVELPRHGPVVVVCARGNTSVIGTRVLRQRGFDAYSLAGGMKAWSMAWNTAELTAPGATLLQVRRTGKG